MTRLGPPSGGPGQAFFFAQTQAHSEQSAACYDLSDAPERLSKAFWLQPASQCQFKP